VENQTGKSQAATKIQMQLGEFPHKNGRMPGGKDRAESEEKEKISD
jgi:hypothetical protein